MNLIMILMLFLAPLQAAAESTFTTTIKETYTTTTNCSTSFGTGVGTSPQQLTPGSLGTGVSISTTITAWFTSVQTITSSSASTYTIASTDGSASSMSSQASSSSTIEMLSTATTQVSASESLSASTSLSGQTTLLPLLASDSATNSISDASSLFSTTDLPSITTGQAVTSESLSDSVTQPAQTSLSPPFTYSSASDSIFNPGSSLSTTGLPSTTGTSAVTSESLPDTVTQATQTSLSPPFTNSSASDSISNLGSSLSTTGLMSTTTSESLPDTATQATPTTLSPPFANSSATDSISNSAASLTTSDLPSTSTAQTVASESLSDIVTSDAQTTYYAVTLPDGSQTYTTLPDVSSFSVATTFYPSVSSDGVTVYFPLPTGTAPSTTEIVYYSTIQPDGQGTYLPFTGTLLSDTTSLSTTTLGDGEISVTPIIIPRPAPTRPIFASRPLPDGGWTFEPTIISSPSTTTPGFFETVLPDGVTVYSPLAAPTTPDIGPGFSLSVGSDGQSGFFPFPPPSSTSDVPGFAQTTDSTGGVTWIPINPQTSSPTGPLPFPFTTTLPDPVLLTSSSSSSLFPGFNPPTSTFSSTSTTVGDFPLLTTPLAEPTVSSTPDSDDDEDTDWIWNWVVTFTGEWERILPPLQDYIKGGSDNGDENVDPPTIGIHIRNLLDPIEGFLDDLPKFPKLPKPSEETGCTVSLFNIFGCIADELTKIGNFFPDLPDGPDPPPGPLPGADELSSEIPKIEDLIDEIQDPKYYPTEEEGDDEPSSSSSSSSSQSCTQSSTSEAEYTTCSSIPITSGTTVSLSETCQTATSTVSGCDIVITGTATTISASCTESTSEIPLATCSPSPVTSGTLTTYTEICSTSTITISGCSISPTGSTTTMSSSSESLFACAPDSCVDCIAAPAATGNAISRRQELNSTHLFRRTLADPLQYVGDNTPENSSGYTGYILKYAFHKGVSPAELHQNYDGRTTALAKTFDAQEGYDVVLKDLYGCTSLVVVSRLGVYISHIWQMPAFEPWRNREMDFDQSVLEEVPHGDPRRAWEMPPLLPLVQGTNAPFKVEGAQDWAALSEGNVVRSFIVTPRNVRDQPIGALRFDDLINELKDYVDNWVPNSEPQIVSYPQDQRVQRWVVDREKQITARGKILIQYDPDEGTREVKKDGETCRVRTSRLRLFVGANPVPERDDVWIAPTSGHFARAGEGTGQEIEQRQDSNDTLACWSDSELLCGSTCSQCTFEPFPQEAPALPQESTALQLRDPHGNALAKRTLAFPSTYVYHPAPGRAFRPNGFTGYILAHARGEYPTEWVNQEWGLSTAKYKVFDGTNPYNLMVWGLHGCTTIVVMSKLGVYMNHLWEIPAFRSVNDPFINMFVNDVENWVPNGDPTRNDMPALLPLTQPGQPFSLEGHGDKLPGGNMIHSWIISPAYENFGTGYRYEALVRRLAARMQEWVPHGDVNIVSYPQDLFPVTAEGIAERDRQHEETARGKVLFQYDPKQDVRKTQVNGQWCDRWWSMFRLYVGSCEIPLWTEHFLPPVGSPAAGAGTGTGQGLHQRQDPDDGLVCELMPSNTSSILSSTASTLSTLSTVPSPSSSGSDSTSTTVSSSTTSNSPQSASSTSTIVSTSATFSPNPTSFSSQSWFFAPTTSAMAFTSCEVTTAPPTATIGDVIKGAATYCQCDGWSASLTTTARSDGATVSICASGSASLTVSTVNAFTSCEVTTAPATATIGDVIKGAATYCLCDGWSASLTTTAGSDGATVSICAFGSASLAVSTQSPVESTEAPPPDPTPTPEYKTGWCGMHVWQGGRNDFDPTSWLSIRIFDAGGAILWTVDWQELAWDKAFTVSSADTKLPWNLDVAPVWERNVGIPPEPPYVKRAAGSDATKRQTGPFRAGTTKVFYVTTLDLVAGPSAFSNMDTAHCSVGKWDEGGFGGWVDDILGPGAWDTREMDCGFTC